MRVSRHSAAAGQISHLPSVGREWLRSRRSYAKSFYMKYGFEELTDNQLHLYLPMKIVNQLNL